MQNKTIIKGSGNTAIVYKDERISYNELLERISFYSSLYEKQDKVAVFAANSPGWVYAFFSAWKHEAISVPIDFMATSDEVAYILNDCKPGVIFYSDETESTLQKALEKTEHKIKSIKISPELVPETSNEIREIDVPDPEKTAVIIYTSGTTGSPKGVMLSFDNLLANIEAVADVIPIFTAERNVLVLLPLHHIFPLLGTLIAPLSVGALLAFSPSMVSQDIISTLQNNKVAIIIGVPRLYEAIRKGVMDKINKNSVAKALFKVAKLVNSRSFSKKIFGKVHAGFGGNVQYMVCGGAKLNEAVAKDYKTLGFEMLEGFGMTEAAPMITFTRPGRWKIGSAGEKMHTLEVTSRDGEIIARGRNIMQGYYNKPEDTAKVIKDGWLHTGDLGYFDKQGFIHITGRSKEIIVLSNGKNINPEEIEIKLKNTSDIISEVAVFANEDMLNAVICPDFKVLHEKGIGNYEEIFRWDVIDKYNKETSPYKKITKFYLSKEELPKTRLGKIQRFKLQDMVSGKISTRKNQKEPEYEEYTVIRDFLKDQKKGDILPDSHLEIDLGLDSLDKVNLLVFLESTFGLNLKEEVFIHNPTVEKLSAYMKEKKNKFTVEAVRWSEILKEKTDLRLPKSWFTQNLFKNSSRIAFKMYFRLKGEGTENIPKSPFILTPNHQSFFDGLFVSVFLKDKIFKNTYFYAKEKHVRNPIVRAFANRNNVIVMDLNKDLKLSLQKLAEVLKKGKNIIIFPEGTRSTTGAVGEFKKFFAILSKELNVPIVPVSIKGAIDALPKGSLFPRPWKKIQVKFHKPVYPEDKTYDLLSDQVFKELSSEVN
ncbi:MAG: AMP-binding protein [Ignavibacteriales bacterium]|nr:AMP-binding protein [Ignavibacteriales bacterium]MCF8316699.1 AMP-binding protein [Ignavibacteriales bacterium]MCF8438343.1 AMP-binding protein [Ignavibacteriales bacterium]